MLNVMKLRMIKLTFFSILLPAVPQFESGDLLRYPFQERTTCRSNTEDRDGAIECLRRHGGKRSWHHKSCRVGVESAFEGSSGEHCGSSKFPI